MISKNTTRKSSVLKKSLSSRAFTTKTNIKTNNNNKQKSPLRYKELFTINNLKKAFNNLKNKAPGLDSQFKTNWPEYYFNKLFNELKSQTYKPLPSKKILIPKPNSFRKRSISIASTKDKIIQVVLKIEFEKHWETVFHKKSHGFRKNRSCHTALKEIRHLWTRVKWMLTFDIEKAFDRNQHEILIKILRGNNDKYHVPENWEIDKATEDLIWKMLKAGYVNIHNLNKSSKYDLNDVFTSKLRIPQESIISPLFCNIYFHQLT